jgi:hypothetical protein
LGGAGTEWGELWTPGRKEWSIEHRAVYIPPP